MRRVVCCSVSAAGAHLVRRLPYEHRPGRLVETVRELWPSVDALVLVGAVGIAVRTVAPLLGGKRQDPAVVSVDDAGRFAIALCGGHAAGANDLAREVAALLGAQPVITTATDGVGLPGLDDLSGLRTDGDVASVTSRWLEGAPPVVRAASGFEAWPLPPGLADVAGTDSGGRVTVSDAARDAEPFEVLLRPSSLVLGVGSSTGAGTDALWDLVASALAGAGVASGAVGAVATLDRKAGEPAIVALARRLGVPLRTFDAAALAGVEVPNPSQVVAGAVGTPSVAEAAALLAAGSGASLLTAKQISATGDSTVAVARRARPVGSLSVVGLGPGEAGLRTAAAVAAVRHADTVIGYHAYVELAADLLRPGQRVVRSPIGAETDRCREALTRAAGGEHVALVCSGDPGVYAMASLVLELAPDLGDPPVTVVPGVTAALSAAAVLGAPLGHDHAAVSLSDLLTPWDVIARRLRALAEGDFVVALYNPRSSRRTTQLVEALAILAAHRTPSTPAAVLTDVGRPGSHVVRSTLGRLDPGEVSMRSLVVVGSSTTRWIGDRMVTPATRTTVRRDRGHRVDVHRLWCLPVDLPDERVGRGTRSTVSQSGKMHGLPGVPGSVPGRRHLVGPAHGAIATVIFPDPRAHPIETESYAILASRVDLSGWAPGARDVVARMIHATADESFASSARIGAGAVQAAVGCLRAGGQVICDSTMVVAGIPAVARRMAVECYLDRVSRAPSGGTRAAAAIALAGSEHPDGALWIIGNAPTALAALVELWRSGQVRPAAVVGLPVGYVGAAEAKAALWDSPLGAVSITNTGPRGGSPVAAAATNALVRLAFTSGE